MKDFRKTKDGLFICEECGKTFVRKENLSRHIICKHNMNKEYFDKWIKENDEGTCKICGKEAIFISVGKGYKWGCCKKHIDLYSYECRKQAMLQNYGVENVFQLEKTKNKIRKTNFEKTGYETPFDKNSPIRLKWEKRLFEEEGITNVFQRKEVKEKSKQTCLEKYGVEYTCQTTAAKEKSKQTCLKNYGVEYCMQNKEVFDKSQKHAFYSYKYLKTDINYRSSNEFDFLDKYYSLFSDIKNGPTIKYNLNNTQKIYFPDFIIPSLNLIIEIKNSYLVKKDKKILKAKQKAVIATGYKFIMIIDKNYVSFEKLLEGLSH